MPDDNSDSRKRRGEQLHRAIEWVKSQQPKVDNAARYFYRGPVASLMGAAGVSAPPPKEPSEEDIKQENLRRLLDEMKYQQEKERIAALKQRLTQGN